MRRSDQPLFPLRALRWASAALIVSGALSGAASCKSSGVSLSVDLRTDYLPGREFATVRTEVIPDGGGSMLSEQAVKPNDPGFVEGSRVADFGDLPKGDALVKVKVFSPEGEPLVERFARVAINGDSGVVCPAPGGDTSLNTCDRGKCVRAECTPSTPQYCGEPECSGDTDCHPDFECVSSRCVGGTCLFLPVDSKCDPKQTCDATVGCTPPLGPACTPTGSTETNCTDGKDDDCDGRVDCIDTDCDGKTCEDGDLCTEGETCSKAACSGGTAKTCDDKNDCTADACDPVTGCKVAPLDSGSCDDGDACTDGDHCAEGKCVGSGSTKCDDGNPCTDDTCDAAGGCKHVNNTATCDDGDACTTGDVCAGGTCKAGTAKSCDDGNACTDDSCDPATGCKNANNTAPCNDDVFCNGADTCASGACTVHAGNPCGTICDEPSKKCLSCLSATDCGPVTYGAWSACTGFTGTCDSSGTRSRTVTTPSCAGGTCSYATSTETEACARVTEGTVCGTVAYGVWGACGGFASTCDTTGTQSRSVTTPTCKSDVCTNVVTTGSQACTRSTTGVTCGTTTYGAWGSCGGFASACDTTGTQSRSRTTYACSGGTCAASTGSVSQSCTRTVANGTSCGTNSYCCSGGCYAKNSAAHCSSCGISCGTGSCVSIGSGHYSCTCSSNQQCIDRGFGSGATCWSPSGTTVCNCQCTTANCCAGGADCYKPSGINYCSY
ncbi:MAG: hypothetical protein HYV09_34210 [Deltaproteobacteria bacterium]|nr:hypothetical protein [Deltaproteobacteria bacterium]